MSDPYRPSNGEEGMMFYEAWCARCVRDRAFRDGKPQEGCDILARTYVLERDDPDYPTEWVWEPENLKRDGGLLIGEGGARCTAFEEDSRGAA